MPIYEYRCAECGLQMEQLQGIDDPAPTCPKCSETVNRLNRMTKQVSRSSFRLEGGGWAHDGYSG